MREKDTQLRISKSASLKLSWLAEKSGLTKKQLASKLFDSCNIKKDKITCTRKIKKSK